VNRSPTPIPFGSSVNSRFRLSCITIFMTGLHMFTPASYLALTQLCDYQEGPPLTIQPPVCTFITLSGLLFIQDPRFTWWYKWFHTPIRGMVEQLIIATSCRSTGVHRLLAKNENRSHRALAFASCGQKPCAASAHALCG
jgi:hypothetical protein